MMIKEDTTQRHSKKSQDLNISYLAHENQGKMEIPKQKLLVGEKSI